MPLIPLLKQKLFRWQSDGQAPIHLGQRRVFILPTKAGLLYALTLLVMLTGAINYNLALGHALVFLLVGLGIIGMLHSFRNLHGLHITAGRCDAVFAGETAYFLLQFGNPRASLRSALSLSTDPEHTIDFALEANSSSEISLPLRSQQRGWLELPRAKLSTLYPLGLFVAWGYLQPRMRCLIYPKILYSTLPAPAPLQRLGLRASESSQEDFTGFRERQPADSPRHVAWKASARNSSEAPLLLKQFAGGSETALWLDWSLTDQNASVETRISQMAGWVIQAEAEQISYGLRLPGSSIELASGPAQRQRCLETLALFQP